MSPLWSYDGSGPTGRGLGRASRAGRSPTLPPLPAPQLRPPGWQADGLLPELLHDLSDPGQVGFAEREVAPRGPHVVADHAGLGGRGETFRLSCDHILSRVQEAPVIPIAGCEKERTAVQSSFCLMQALPALLFQDHRPPGQKEARGQPCKI